jgi:hypothetical protein
MRSALAVMRALASCCLVPSNAVTRSASCSRSVTRVYRTKALQESRCDTCARAVHAKHEQHSGPEGQGGTIRIRISTGKFFCKGVRNKLF